MKPCTKCHEVKPLNDFYRYARAKDGKMSKCKTCQIKYKQDWRAKNPNRYKAEGIKMRYGISLELYNQRMNAVSGCEICGIKNEKMCYDHDHTTNAFRGILCDKCNRGLGVFGDNTAGLSRALSYLKKKI